MHTFVKILEGLFVLGVIGCCITIPLAAWGYFSVLFDKDTEEEERDSANPSSSQRFCTAWRPECLPMTSVVCGTPTSSGRMISYVEACFSMPCWWMPLS